MKTVHVALLITLFCSAGILSAAAQDRVQESSTGKYFPVQVSITNEGKTYTLSLTGTTVRKKMIFKVYGIAHHMEDPQPGSLESVHRGRADRRQGEADHDGVRARRGRRKDTGRLP